MFQNENESSSPMTPRISDDQDASGRRFSIGAGTLASRKLRKSSSVGNAVLKKVSSIETFGSNLAKIHSR